MSFIIKRIVAREILESRGSPTTEVDVSTQFLSCLLIYR